ncbi:hypothetical protein [Polyangium sp. 15x6]|uniref:hypothetical protein n=1 Tax=Polyangium sp. 15x6 TaxID=3042687 RepID=UPI00249CAAAC|nr:hypothetical protein [Polyangium sp. 15x6]MDI3285336.1 hypothetical protein [Polyangium sp. 15x6]
MDISQEAIDLIIAWEVAGGERELARSLYDRRYTHPHWPGNEASGLTIGIGYDLRHQTNNFEGDWKMRLSALPVPDAYDRLRAYLGVGGGRAAERATRDISIPWDDAMIVFRIRRLPSYIDLAKSAFPGVDALGPHVWGALTSLVYNCGTKTKDKPLKKKAYDSIRAAIAGRSIRGVADGIREMKAFHTAATPEIARGLHRRRDAEAELVMRTWILEAGEVVKPNLSVA